MKSETTRKLNRYESLDRETAITPENLPIEKSERNPIEGEVDLEDVSSNSDGGFRVKWTRGSYSAVIEEKIGDEWRAIGGVQKLTIEFDVEKPLPIVKMERFIIGKEIKDESKSGV